MQKEIFKREINWILKEKYQGQLTKATKKDIIKLQAGEPVDYLIGFVEFLGCRIDLSFKPLIPRLETEYWVELAIKDIKDKIKNTKNRIRALDIFAGSGCIGVAVLKHIPQIHVDFAENEKKLLQQIKLNLKKNRILKKRFQVFHSNIFYEIYGKYDYIFANPPYIADGRIKRIQPSVLKHEPVKALFGGIDGLKYIKRFFKESKKRLHSNGKIYLEFDSPQRKEINRLLKKFEYSSWQFYKDQYGKWRFVVVKN